MQRDMWRADLLTARERQVLALAAQGWTYAETAAHFRVSEQAIKMHFLRMFRKLGARNRTHAVAIAYQLNVLPGEVSGD